MAVVDWRLTLPCTGFPRRSETIWDDRSPIADLPSAIERAPRVRRLCDSWFAAGLPVVTTVRHPRGSLRIS